MQAGSQPAPPHLTGSSRQAHQAGRPTNEVYKLESSTKEEELEEEESKEELDCREHGWRRSLQLVLLMLDS
jgi:hypothetical protein